MGITSFILFFLLYFFDVLRVSRKEEEVGLDVAFHGGDEYDERFAAGGGEGDSESGMKRFVTWRRLRKLGGLAAILNRGGDGTGELVLVHPFLKKRRDIWHRTLEFTPLGPFSLAMYEANYIMEDTVQVDASHGAVFIGVHDGHGGSEAAEFLRDSLYNNLKKEFVEEGGAVSVDTFRRAFKNTDREFTDLVRDSFDESPHLATVGACSAVAIVIKGALWVANVGDCRAVLGQVRRLSDGIECRALQMSIDHNLSFSAIREQFIAEHADMPDAVTEKRGRYRVKGKVTVTRAFGDLYLKYSEFNREPLFTRFRVSEPFNPPLLTAEPHVAVRLLNPHDAFVIVGSDGLFELLSNQEAVDIVASSPRKDIARELIRAAMHRAAEKHEIPYSELLRMSAGERREYHDDITVVVFFFDHDGIKKFASRAEWKNNQDGLGSSSLNSSRSNKSGGKHGSSGGKNGGSGDQKPIAGLDGEVEDFTMVHSIRGGSEALRSLSRSRSEHK